MPKIQYLHKRFSEKSIKIIDTANDIIREYIQQGFSLTLRQLYYQFVARGLMENDTRNYKRLGSVINDARLNGMVDWEAIEDRTRNLADLAHWENPGEIVKVCSEQFRVDRWENQPYRVEVWIEKEALAGVFQRVCEKLDVPYFSCRGYTSQSEMWVAAQRLLNHAEKGQEIVILHFGDHDPSGIDMSRDIQDRMRIFGIHLDFRRLALNMDQVKKFNPPPNPAKQTDSRYAGYIAEFGGESWELDALEPRTLAALVERAVDGLVEIDAWDESIKKQNEGRDKLLEIAEEMEGNK